MPAPVNPQLQADLLVEKAMQNPDINDKIYSLAYALGGAAEFRLEAVPGSGHDYGEVLRAVYRYNALNPNSGIDTFLPHALEVVASSKKNPDFLRCGKDLVRMQLNLQKNGAAGIRCDEALLYRLLGEAPASAGGQAESSVGGKKHTGLIVGISIAAVISLVLLGGFLLFKLRPAPAPVEAVPETAEEETTAPIETEPDTLALGQAAMEEGRYEEAAAYFAELGDDAKDQWVEAVYQQAAACKDAGETDKALELLEQIAEDTRAVDLKNEILLASAEAHLAAGEYAEAEEAALAVVPTDNADPNAFLDRLHHTAGVELVQAGKLEDALDHFRKCRSSDAEAVVNAEILSCLAEKACSKSADAISEALRSGSTDIDADVWNELFTETFKELSLPSIDEALDYVYGTVTMQNQTDLTVDDAAANINNLIEGKDCIRTYSGNVWSSSFKRVTVENLDTLIRTQCHGTTGKVLIVNEASAFPNNAHSWAVMADAMLKLPQSMLPTCLEEVQYVLVIHTNFQRNGNYTAGTAGVREYATVSLHTAEKNNTIYTSGQVYGDPAPNTISYYGSAPTYWTEGQGDITELVRGGLNKVK